jgi:hypothetical protein
LGITAIEREPPPAPEEDLLCELLQPASNTMEQQHKKAITIFIVYPFDLKKKEFPDISGD